jgi:hypothetical protein
MTTGRTNKTTGKSDGKKEGKKMKIRKDKAE